MKRAEMESGSAAGELVAQGQALMRVENDSLLRVAIERPRKEADVLRGAMSELDLVPEEAGKAFYSIPYREKQPDGSYKIVKVEGPSIKAAMTLSRRWGNCSVTSRILNEDGEGFDLEGVFIDFETNFRVSRPFRVSKFAKMRKGGIYTLDPQKLGMALQAGASKAMRNATLAGLPAYLVSAYEKRAKQIVGGNLDAKADQKTIDAVLKAFGRWSVTKEQLEKYEELPTAQWTGTNIAALRGLWNAIQDGQTTVEEVFRPEQQEEGQAEPAKTLDLSGAQVTGEDNAAPGRLGSIRDEEGSESESAQDGAASTPSEAPPSESRINRSVLLGQVAAMQDKLKLKTPARDHLWAKHCGDATDADVPIEKIQALHAELQGYLAKK